MKTVGEILQQARLKKGLSLKDLSEQIKIRPDYLEAIEKNHFSRLPSATFVKGFISGYAKAVDLSPDHVQAVFRRDFDQSQTGEIVPRGLTHPIHTPSRLWHPKTTTAIISAFLILLVGAYFVKQLLSLNQAPPIDLAAPPEGQTTTAIVDVIGSTDPDATITINQKPVSTNLQGEFKTTLNLGPGPQVITVTSQSRDGKTRTLERHILVEQQ